MAKVKGKGKGVRVDTAATRRICACEANGTKALLKWIVGERERQMSKVEPLCMHGCDTIMLNYFKENALLKNALINHWALRNEKRCF